MPLYQYQCPKCSKVQSEFRSIDERDNGPRCCGVKADRLFQGCNLMPFRFPYVHQTLAEKPILIESRKQEKHEFASRRLVDAR